MGSQVNNREHIALSFYGFIPRRNIIAEFYKKCLAWFEDFGYTPRIMGHGASKKLGDFKRLSRGAAADGFSLEKTKYMSLYSEPYDPSDPAKGADLEFAIRPKENRSYCYVSFISTVPRASERLIRLAREAAELVEPTYGIGQRGTDGLRLTYFAMGLGYGIREETEQKENRLISWRENIWAQLFRDGYLGGVFPWNFLTAPQLSASVGASTLQEWIKAKPSRGSLQTLTDQMVLWAVPDGRIPDVYQALWEAEVVFDYQRHIDRGGPGIIKRGDLPPAGRKKDWRARANPPSPPMSGEEVVSDVLQAFGYQSPEEVQVLKVEEPGRTRDLSKEEVQKLLDAKNNKGKGK